MNIPLTVEEVLKDVIIKSPLGNELYNALYPEDRKVFEMLMKRGAERWAEIQTKKLQCQLKEKEEAR